MTSILIVVDAVSRGVSKMKAISVISAILWLLHLASAIEYIDLEPVPRHLWDTSLQKRQNADEPANVTLNSHEELMFQTPPNTPNQTEMVVTMVVWTKQDRLIIDMARFAFQLKAVNCKEDMWVEFYHNKTFQAVKKSWEWVNFNGMRSFVLIPDHLKCGRDWSLEPWLVSGVTFDQTNLKVSLDAVKSSWKNVTHTYNIDFGEIQRGGTQSTNIAKRQEFERALTLNLASSWPSKIFSKKWPHSSGTVTFDITCVECGTQGTLVFAGHIEGNPITGIDKLWISADPNGIRADLNLEVTLAGTYNFKGKDFAKSEWTLLNIPLPYSIRIARVFQFGPHADIIAGYELGAIEGEATIGAGVAAIIPDDSFAKVDIFGQRKLDVRGWVPKVETKPLTFDAQISASGLLYTKLAVAASIEVFDDTGVTVDVNLEFPKFSIEAATGYISGGFCPNSANPFGVSLDITVGVEVELEAWGEVDGKRKTFFDVDLYENDNIYSFPPICKSWGGGDGEVEGSCAIDLALEDEQWYHIEVLGQNSDPARRKRAPATSPLEIGSMASHEPTRVKARQDMELLAEDKPYTLECDTSSQYPIKMKTHDVPLTIVGNGQAPTPVPIMKSLLGCTNDNLAECGADRWNVVHGDASDVTTMWNTEHIYEGNWLRDFYDELKKTQYPDMSCKDFAENILGLSTTGPVTGGYADQLRSALGHNKNHGNKMALLNGKENRVKHRMFEESLRNIYLYKKSDLPNIKIQNQVCRLGRIINACKYMDDAEIQSRLQNTILDLVRVMVDMDGEYFQGNDVIRKVHKDYMPNMYRNGIDKTREYIAQMARYIHIKSDDDDWDKLDQQTKDAIIELEKSRTYKDENDLEGQWDKDNKANIDKYCKSSFTYNS